MPIKFKIAKAVTVNYASNFIFFDVACIFYFLLNTQIMLKTNLYYYCLGQMNG